VILLNTAVTNNDIGTVASRIDSPPTTANFSPLTAIAVINPAAVTIEAKTADKITLRMK
jgi:hypothetical protein